MECNNRPTLTAPTTLNVDGNKMVCMVTYLYYYIKYCFNFTASQMWLLGRILAILVGDCIDDDDDDECWNLFLKLMDIVDILISPCVSDDYAAYVATLHHHEFCRIYPTCSVIPKMHFMVHMGRLMIQYV